MSKNGQNFSFSSLLAARGDHGQWDQSRKLLAVTGMLLFFPIIGKDLSGASQLPIFFFFTLKMGTISEVITTI